MSDINPTSIPSASKARAVPVNSITANLRNPRKHSRQQVKAIAKSIQSFGFNVPILVDGSGTIVAGHGRYEASKLIGLSEVPVIYLDHLTEAQAKAFMLADNKLTDRSSWDDAEVALHLKELSELTLDFEIDATGFEVPEIDLRIQSIQDPNSDAHDEFEPPTGPSTALPGDIWCLGQHRLACGSSLDQATYDALLAGEIASAVFTDPPYNVKIDGHATGNGQIRHREFAMASGEMTSAEYSDFLSTVFALTAKCCVDGSLIYSCTDWRHIEETLLAQHAAKLSLINLCVWAKTNGGMGSLYRSRHELIFVFKNGTDPHLNNVQLGRFGRNRTNIWNYPGANSFDRRGQENRLEFHPTVKPIALVADAILDCTKRGDIVLDPFLGSGTTILAAERTGRRGYGIELDPQYVDTTIDRWQRMTGGVARNAHNRTFEDIKAERYLR